MAITVEGATAESFVLVSADTNPDQIIEAKGALAATGSATLDNTTSARIVEVVGTDNGSVAATTVWTCNIATPATQYLTAVTGVNVLVSAAEVI